MGLPMARKRSFSLTRPSQAAINGRLLILDGVEQVERNVLPTLNNLLENREMQLEDGRFLGSQELPVHEDFKVIALSPGPTVLRQHNRSSVTESLSVTLRR